MAAYIEMENNFAIDEKYRVAKFSDTNLKYRFE